MKTKFTKLAISLSVLSIMPWASTYAQTATDLQCALCVNTADLANNAVGTGKLKGGAVATGKIKNNAVTRNKLSADIRNLLDQLEALTDIINISGTTVEFEGVNLQVTNGTGQTDIVNGTGNLIVGYDESVGLNGFGSQQICSDGAFDNQNDCLSNGGTFSNAQKTGSHNLVVGMGHSYTQFGGTVLGTKNAINREHANVTGGELNIASGLQASGKWRKC